MGLDRKTLTGCSDFTSKRAFTNPNLLSDAVQTMGLTGPKVGKPKLLVSRAVTGHEASHVLFPQMLDIVDRYVREKVKPLSPAQTEDAFLSPYYGLIIERLSDGIQPYTSQGEAPEVSRTERNRPDGSSDDVDFWTSRDVREVEKSHPNYVVLDTRQWEQSAAFLIDRNPNVEAFVKNAGLGFAIPYLHNGAPHEYVPDFIVRLSSDPLRQLILETKGFDELEDVKRQAAERWVAAVNADGRYGHWEYAVAKKVTEIDTIIASSAV